MAGLKSNLLYCYRYFLDDFCLINGFPMKKNYYTLLSLSILTALYSAPSLADLKEQCLLGVPHFNGKKTTGDPNSLPVYITADRAELNQPTNALYEGNVEIKQGNRYFQGQKAEVIQRGEGEQAQRYAYATGGFQYADELIRLAANNATIHLNSKDADINQADYTLVDRQGRDTAEQAELREDYVC